MHLIETIQPKLPKLVSDYLTGKEDMKDFSSFEPSIAGLKHAAEQRSFSRSKREILAERLLVQAQGVETCSEATLANIEKLKQDDVFTVTTGHQLCLYGGPLFFFYKILSVVKLSKQLAEVGVDCVPVYWMASEDHDFEEINHVFLGQNKYTWENTESGAVGHMNLSYLDAFKAEVKAAFKDDFRYEESLDRLNAIFNSKQNLAGAIRELVQWVFGEYGIVVIDGDDAELKSMFAPVLTKELEQGFSEKALVAQTEKLEKLDYAGQIAGREINLFYLESGYRERIVKSNEGFGTADGKFTFTKDEMSVIIANSPERLSPNVVLRPLYQEVILPNIAYVGGPGETSYWLQLKGVFDESDVPMPVVLLRDMFMLVDEKVERKREQLAVNYEQLSGDLSQLFTSLVRKAGTHEHIAESAKSSVDEELENMIAEIATFDVSLVESAKSEQTRILRRLDVLKEKLLRSDKRQNETIQQRLDYIAQHINPQDTPQERIHNWLNYFPSPKEAHELLAFCNPLETELKVVRLT